MNFLLDTHTFIWFVEDDVALNKNTKSTIEDGTNTIYLSLASIWEMAIKVNLGKLRFRVVAKKELMDSKRRYGFRIVRGTRDAFLPLLNVS
jgi:PIN domain nuclease of toxin-antitoxin system